MPIILDVSVIAIIVIFTVIGIKHGAVREIVSIVSIFVALFLALWLSNLASSYVYNNFAEESVRNSIYSSVEGAKSSDVVTLIENLPEKIINAGSTVDVDISAELKQNIGNNDDIVAKTTDIITEKVAKPLTVAFIRIIIFIILFIILKILLNLLCKALNIVSKIPVIGTLNKVLGGGIGFVKGVVIALIICYVFIICLKFSVNGMLGITYQTVENSTLFKFLSDILA